MDGNPWAAISVGLAVLGWLVTVVGSFARQQMKIENLATKDDLSKTEEKFAQKLKDERKEVMQDVRQLLYDLRLID